MLFAWLVAIRDVLVAAALAWVGVTLETQREAQPACADARCEQQD